MEEQVFMNTPGVMVSSSRIEIGGQTFATRNVGSVKVEKKGMSLLALFIAVVGLASLAVSPTFGVCAFLVGAIWAYVTATKRTLKLIAGGGEVVALQTGNPQYAESVRVAIANAISVR